MHIKMSLLRILAVVALSFALFACASSSNSDNPPPPVKTEMNSNGAFLS